MSDAPKQIWVWWDDEYDVGVVSKHGDKRYIPDEAREYVRADRIEQLVATCELLEAKLEKAVETLEWVKFGGGPNGESYYLNACATLEEIKGSNT